MHTVIFAGDPHGDHKPIIRACLDHAPGTLVVLGDFDLEEPLRKTYGRVLEAGWRLRYIHGNHETDRPQYHDNLLEDAPGWSISGGFVDAGGHVIGGLGGVFKDRVWYPRDEATAEPKFRSRAEFMRQMRLPERWKKGLPLGQRDTVFPEDVDGIAAFRLDILVTHEAPQPHKYGFAVLNQLADRTGARLLVHGHHHRSDDYEAVLPSGRTLRVRSLAKAEPWVLEMPVTIR
jgi:predicted phosphodiesterase